MAAPIIFRDLPATFPERDRYKKPSIMTSVIFHAILIGIAIVIPVLLRQTISESQLLTVLVSPVPPPPAPPAPHPDLPASAQPKAVQRAETSPSSDGLVMPTAVPEEIARIMDEPIVPSVGTLGGVPGGIPGGVAGGVPGSVLSDWAKAPQASAPLPPPLAPEPAVVAAAAPSQPIRVGGSIQEPRLIKMVPPVYPKMASMARIAGTVVLEATVTVDGTVQEIRVLSGHPLLIQAAIDSVKQWQYEPTLLNGVPAAVILTAKVHFKTRFES
jgi:protein TonB